MTEEIQGSWRTSSSQLKQSQAQKFRVEELLEEANNRLGG